jgi:hypothetical protein
MPVLQDRICLYFENAHWDLDTAKQLQNKDANTTMATLDSTVLTLNALKDMIKNSVRTPDEIAYWRLNLLMRAYNVLSICEWKGKDNSMAQSLLCDMRDEIALGTDQTEQQVQEQTKCWWLPDNAKSDKE